MIGLFGLKSKMRGVTIIDESGLGLGTDSEKVIVPIKKSKILEKIDEAYFKKVHYKHSKIDFISLKKT